MPKLSLDKQPMQCYHIIYMTYIRTDAFAASVDKDAKKTQGIGQYKNDTETIRYE